MPSKASRQTAFPEFIRLRLNLDKYPEGRGFHPGPPTSAPDGSSSPAFSLSGTGISYSTAGERGLSLGAPSGLQNGFSLRSRATAYF